MISAHIASLVYLTLGIIIILLGLIILKENTRERINRITGVMMFFAGTGPIFGAFGLLLQTSPEAALTLAPFGKLFLIWEFFFPQMLLFALVFPREVNWAKRHPVLVYALFLPHVIHFILVVSFSSPDQIRNLIDIQAFSENVGWIIQPVTLLLELFLSMLGLIYRFHTNFFALINLIYIIVAIGLMVWGYRTLRSPRLKKQVGLVLWGIRASVGLYAIAFIFPHLNILHTSQGLTYLLTSAALLIGAGSIAWAIIRYQFLDIRLIIRKGLIFSVSSALLIGIYLLVYSQGKRIVSEILRIRLPLLEITFLILALLFFQPILGSIERLIERLFMKDRLDYRNILQDLSRDILTTLETQALREKITTTLSDAMSLEFAELLVPDVDGVFTSHRDGDGRFFDPREEWIQALREEEEPVSYDQLCLRLTDGASLEKLRRLRPHLLIPFLHRERLVGILVLGRKFTKTNFTAEDMTVLSVLSSQASIALENARLYEETMEKQRMEEELGLAREIQKHLLPSHIPSGPSFELAGYNLPSKEVGGDYYDFVQLDPERVGIAIGDIAGKGIPAALLMSNLQAALRISSVQSGDTSEVMNKVNMHITRTTSAEKFATFFYGVFDTKALTFDYTNAGHNYPVHTHGSGGHSLLKGGGIIIGVKVDAPYTTKRIAVEPGDSLVFYTDGITEALNAHQEEYGEERLIEASERAAHLPARSILDRILESVIDFTHGHLQSDDLTLVVLKMK